MSGSKEFSSPESVMRSVSKAVLSPGSSPMSSKRKRAFHRLVSGLTRGRSRGELMRFLTLTTGSGGSDLRLRRDFQLLRRRIERTFHFKPEYWSIRTNEGNGVLHIVFKGRYVPQKWLSKAWSSIHGACIVDIRALHGRTRRIANYLVTQYLGHQSFERMSWSWGWVFRGFCGLWASKFSSWYKMDREACLSAWNKLICTFSPPLPVIYGSLYGG